ncbi:MAG: hypothetical protein LBT68_06035, partial [Spirochaetales bacterium]|nr:hypothetical protein [Spirochaetales bacterium]
MDKDEIVKKLNKLTGKAGNAVKLYTEYKDCGYNEREKKLHELSAALVGSAKNMGEVFDNGPRQAFEAVHGKAIAGWAGKVARRLHLYAYSPSTYRRSFRTRETGPCFDRFLQIMDTLFFSWEDYDMVKELSTPKSDKADETRLCERHSGIYSDFLAVSIDEKDAAVISAVEEIMLGDNNTQALSDSIISGITKCENTRLRGLLTDMLLAARLQEGLRQSILENADTGRVEALTDFMKLIMDNDLLRYSSVVRAVDVWMGLVYEAADKRVTSKLLELGYTYLLDEKARKAAVKSKDAIEIYA